MPHISPSRFRPLHFSAGALLASLAVCAALAGEASHPAPAPQAEALEAKTRAVAASCVQATVALFGGFQDKEPGRGQDADAGMSSGSGVLVSVDGLVLTAAHVVAGHKAMLVRLNDGTLLKGTVLGTDKGGDVAMLRLQGAAPKGGWPHVAVAPAGTLKPGDWTLATGHPGGCKVDRPPPLRVGRVLEADAMHLSTDCTVMPGDSGGPLFDLQGRVVGIHSNISLSIHDNRHAPVGLLLANWDSLLAGKPAFTKGGMLAQGGGARESPGRRQRREQGATLGSLLSGQGGSAARAFGDASPEAQALLAPSVQAAGPCMVKLVASNAGKPGKQLELGTVVSADGLLLTAAEGLPESKAGLLAVLPDGRAAPVEFIGADKPTGLALLKVKAGPLTPAPWAGGGPSPLGAWVAAPFAAEAAAIGVVSVKERPIPKAEKVCMGESKVSLGIGVASPFSTVLGTVMKGLPAEAAGFKVGDRVLSVDGKAVRTPEQLTRAIRSHPAGATLAVEIERAGKPLTLRPTLAQPTSAPMEFTEPAQPKDAKELLLAGSQLSRHTVDFSAAIQHDAVLSPRFCGGPLVNLKGEVVGINVSRFDRIGTYAIPAKEAQAAVERMRKGK